MIVILNESLITSYDLIGCQSDLKRRFHTVKTVIRHYDSPYVLLGSVSKGKYVGSYEIVLSDESELPEICKAVEAYYGWHPSMVKLNGEDYVDWGRDGKFVSVSQFEENPEIEDSEKGEPIEKRLGLLRACGRKIQLSLFVEPNFTSEVDLSSVRQAYHATSDILYEKIKRNGLVPKSKGNFPDRIYFGTDIDDVISMTFSKKNKLETDKILFRLNLNTYRDEISSKYKFYSDPRNENSFYTYDCIDPKYLQIAAKPVSKMIDADGVYDGKRISFKNFI